MNGVTSAACDVALWNHYLFACRTILSLLPILGGGLKHLWFSPSFGEDAPILTHTVRWVGEKPPTRLSMNRIEGELTPLELYSRPHLSEN